MNTNTDLKGSSFTLPVLHLAGKDLEQDIAFLTQKVEQAPGFFTNAPVVLNIEAVEGEIDFEQLKSGVLRAGMIPVGIAGCKTARSRTQAADAGLAVMNSSKTATREQVPITPVKVIRTPVRSGQQIYAKDGDLLVLNHVSAGAEVIADGSIHIHGTLRGRAIAGASGQKEARIICHDLQAELVSVNGNYWLSDQIDSGFWQKKVMVSLTDDQLQLDVLSI